MPSYAMSSSTNPWALNYNPSMSGFNKLPMSSESNPAAAVYRPRTGDVLGDIDDKGPGPVNNPAPSNNSGFNKMDRNANPGSGWFWDAADGWKQGGGGDASGGGSGTGIDPELDRLLNESYNTGMAAANQAGTDAQLGFETDTKNLNTRVNNSLQDIGIEEKNLLGSTDTEQGKFDQVLRSALSDAIRAFNALQQQAKARFGAGSSAGQAVGELAQQEYFRQQGAVQQKGVEGTAQFAEEKAKIGQFVTQKKRDLDQFKQEALDTLTKNLRDTMGAINARKGDLEINKQQARLSALMEARSKAEAIATADKEFRQNLAVAAVNQFQQVSGKTFSPAEIKAYIADFMSDLPGSVGPGAAQGGGAVTTASYNPNAVKKDELNGLTGNTQYVNSQRQLV